MKNEEELCKKMHGIFKSATNVQLKNTRAVLLGHNKESMPVIMPLYAGYVLDGINGVNIVPFSVCFYDPRKDSFKMLIPPPLDEAFSDEEYKILNQTLFELVGDEIKSTEENMIDILNSMTFIETTFNSKTRILRCLFECTEGLSGIFETWCRVSH